MGLIGRTAGLLKVIVEGGAVESIEHAADPGDDALPIDGDSAAIIRTQRSGQGVAVGYFDTVNSPKASAGDKRIYSRDPSSGAMVAEVWLKTDGSILGSNGAGSFELKASGDFVINGATITAAGLIIDALGRVLSTHVHPITSGSSAPGPTGPAV